MECQNFGSNWFEVLLVVVGSFLVFLLSILTTFINKRIDKNGEVRIFYKLLEQQAKIGVTENEQYLLIPVYFELQNTSNTTRVIRDVSLYIYNNGKQVVKMMQIQCTKDSKTNELKNSFGGEKNSYSFVLPPLSIQKQECEFLYKVPTSKVDEKTFDEIRFAYFNEKNQVMDCLFSKAEQGWNGIEFNYDNEYAELKCVKKKK